MLPEFNADGLLPPGVHEAGWEELVGRFGYNPWRVRLLVGKGIVAIDLEGWV